MFNEYSDCDSAGVTRHAYRRLRERNGWNKKASNRMVSKIYETGLRKDDIKGYVRMWLKHLDSDNDREYVVYGNYIYIFLDKNLLTAFPIPSKEFIKKYYY